MLTISVLAVPALPGSGGTHLGVTSTTSPRSLTPGLLVVLVIMLCMGPGLTSSEALCRSVGCRSGPAGKMLLLFGYRNPGGLFVSEVELREWFKGGVADEGSVFLR